MCVTVSLEPFPLETRNLYTAKIETCLSIVTSPLQLELCVLEVNHISGIGNAYTSILSSTMSVCPDIVLGKLINENTFPQLMI